MVEFKKWYLKNDGTVFIERRVIIVFQMQEAIRFGPSGVPRRLNGASTLEGLAEVGRLGLQAMELSFVHRVNIREEHMPEVRETASQHDVALSAHASYYINLNSREKAKVKASRQRILDAARAGLRCGATDIVFHAAWRHGDSADRAYETVRGHLVELRQQLDEEGVSVCLRPETTGKESQFGDLDELLSLAEDIPGVQPCVDFAHLHARRGDCNSEAEFHQVLERIEKRLGAASLRNMHMHISGIEYGQKGELRHLILSESDLHYELLLKVLCQRGVAGRIICESPANDADAMELQQMWRHLTANC